MLKCAGPESFAMASDPHPQLQPILELLDEAPPLHEADPVTAREQYEKLRDPGEPEPVESVEDRRIDGPGGEIPIRIYRVAQEPRPTIVYFHGGGFVIGNVDTHDGICRALANATGYTVVSVDYRLAPEHPFPAPHEDAYAATEWAKETFDGDLVVAGDSAGGNLAAAVAIMARDVDGPAIDRQLLIYPTVASSFHEFDSYPAPGEGYLLRPETMEWFESHLTDSPFHARNEYRSPLLLEDFSGLAPATILTAELDPLHDEGVRYAENLRADGVEVVHRDFEAMVHGFIGFLDAVDAAREGIDALASTLPEP